MLRRFLLLTFVFFIVIAAMPALVAQEAPADRAAAAQVEEEDLLVYLLGDEARSVLKGAGVSALSLSSPAPGETGEYFPPGQAFLSTSFNQVWAPQRGNDAEARPPAPVTSRESITQLERALAKDPTRVDLRCELGRLYLARGDYAAAYNHFTDLITETLGDHCQGVARKPAAGIDAAPTIRELELALAQDPKRADLRCELGQLHHARGNYAAAYAQFSYLIRETLGDHCGS